MTIRRLFPEEEFTDEQLLAYAALASKAENHDPIDDAVLTAVSARQLSLSDYQVTLYVKKQ